MAGTIAPELFERIVDLAPDAMVGVDASGKILFVNVQAQKLFGYDERDLLGAQLERLIPDRFRSVHPEHRRTYFAAPLARPMGARLSLFARRSDGTEFPCEISLNSLETADGTIVCAAIRDSTERVKNQRKFEGLLESAPDAIVGVNASGTIAFVNSQTQKLFGYDREELVGELIEVLVPEDLRKNHPSHRDNYFTQPQARPMGVNLSLTARRRDGSTFPCEISLNSLDTEDGVLVSAAVRDITERVAAERERQTRALQDRERQAQRLESIGQLAGGVAHDFNNLLAVIINYAGFLTDALPESAPELKADVEEIRHAAERAAALTKQLLIFARREVVAERVIDLNALLVELEKLLRRTIRESVELRTSFGADLWSIFADPGRIEQVVLNLVVNARDAMPQGGSLTISTTNFTLTPEDVFDLPDLGPGDYVLMSVADGGRGMTPDVIGRAFEPFFTTKAKGEGTGLGLATVYGIVSQAGGAVHLYSELGKGTVARVYLPATMIRAASEATAPEVEAVGQGETILVVEDEDAVREIARRILSQNGYEVVTANSGTEALDALASGVHPNLILTDVVMPQMSGRDLVEQITTLLPDVKVLYMSGYPQGVIADHGALQPGVVLLEKPFTSSLLLRRIREVLEP